MKLDVVRWALGQVLGVLLLIVGALALWVSFIAAGSYIQSPKLVAELERVHVLPVAPSDLPRDRLCALLAVQDPTFYRHHGIGLRDGHLGHTTITQAIGKGLFFNGFDPGFLRHRKIHLMVAAWAFDRRISKETQLRIFLNRGYFGTMPGGEEIMGFPAASRKFFGQPLSRISDDQYLGLLAMLDGPDRYSVMLQPASNAERVAQLRPMVARACAPGCFQGEAPIPCE